MIETIVRRRRSPPATAVRFNRGIAVSSLMVALWAGVTVSVWLGRLPLSPRLYSVLLLGVPFLSIAGFAVSRDERLRSFLARLAGGTSVVAGAILASKFTPVPVVIFGTTGVAVAVAVVRRWPGPAMAVMFAISGSYGSIAAYTRLHAGIIVQLAILGLWIAAFSHYLRTPRVPRFVLVPGVLLVVAYTGLTIASLFVQRGGGLATVRAFLSSVWLMSAFVVIAYGPWSKETIKWVVRFVIVVGVLVGAYATLRWITGPAAREQAYVHAAADYGRTAAGPGGAKVIGSLPSGAALGAWTATALPFCLALCLFGSRRMRLLSLGIPFMLTGLLGSGNRGSLVAAAAGVTVIIALAMTSRANVGPRFAKVGVFGIAAALCGALLFPAVVGDNPTKTARYANILKPGRDASFNARLVKWREALGDASHDPFGRGIGTASPGRRRQRFPSPAADNVDSAYIQVAYEQGIPVMVLFIVALLSTLLAISRRARRATEADSAVPAIGAAGTLSAFLVVCVAGQFQFDLVALGTWVIVGVGLYPFVKLNGARTKA